MCHTNGGILDFFSALLYALQQQQQKGWPKQMWRNKHFSSLTQIRAITCKLNFLLDEQTIVNMNNGFIFLSELS